MNINVASCDGCPFSRYYEEGDATDCAYPDSWRQICAGDDCSGPPPDWCPLRKESVSITLVSTPKKKNPK